MNARHVATFCVVHAVFSLGPPGHFSSSSLINTVWFHLIPCAGILQWITWPFCHRKILHTQMSYIQHIILYNINARVFSFNSFVYLSVYHYIYISFFLNIFIHHALCTHSNVRCIYVWDYTRGH